MAMACSLRSTGITPASSLLRSSPPQHHHAVARRGHEVVTFLDHLSILAVVQPKFLEPLKEISEHFEAPAFHACQHVEQAGFNGHVVDACAGAGALELRMLMQHV